jgi:prophage maintenance system killer protein
MISPFPRKSGKPWPWNTLPERRPADWGIGMTVCIAAHNYRSKDNPTIYDKAACLFFSIAGGHIFSNGNKRASVLALDQFLSANSIYLFLSNRQIKNDAEKTASYRTRGEDHKNVMARLSRRFEKNSIPFSVVRAFDGVMYRELLEVRKIIRNNELNRPGTRPKQAINAS